MMSTSNQRFAAELMARFQVPFTHNGSQGVISGGWIGTKCC